MRGKNLDVEGLKQQAAEIRELHAAGYSTQKLAGMFHVKGAIILEIIKGSERFTKEVE